MMSKPKFFTKNVLNDSINNDLGREIEGMFKSKKMLKVSPPRIHPDNDGKIFTPLNKHEAILFQDRTDYHNKKNRVARFPHHSISFENTMILPSPSFKESRQEQAIHDSLEEEQ